MSANKSVSIGKKVKSVEGSAYCLGDLIDCDTIIPVRFCIRPTNEILARYCLTQIDKRFPEKVQEGVIIVAGKEFGRGSANENAVRALQVSGVRAVIAESVARIYRRNSLNLGFAALSCHGITEHVKDGHKLRIDLERWAVKNLDTQEELQLEPISEIESDILNCEGLVKYLLTKGKLVV